MVLDAELDSLSNSVLDDGSAVVAISLDEVVDGAIVVPSGLVEEPVSAGTDEE